MIEIENLHAGYGQVDILKGIDAGAEPGRLIALIGPNGCGKSTLLKTLCGILAPKTGIIRLNGQEMRTFPANRRARTVAYLAQSREVAPGLSVRDILEIGRAPHCGRLGQLSTEDQRAMDETTARAQVTEFLNRPFATLSGGEQARILLARALTVQAPILLADEPIAALDPYYQLTMMALLRAEADQGTLVITALHDLALAAHYADEVWVMQNGCLYATGTPEQCLTPDCLKDVFRITPPRDGFVVPETVADQGRYPGSP